MKAILTGASGFLGNAIVSGLKGYDVITLARTNAQIKADLSRSIPLLPVADLVIHSAGKAHIVPKTQAEKQDFFDVNVTGTQNLLAALDALPQLPNKFVLISTVAVYGCDSGKNITENTPLQATDPYGASKIKAEQIVTEWCEKRGITCAILRLPLLAGSNPPGNLGAMISAIKKGYYVNIAGGLAKKSMVLISDVAAIIPKAAEVGGIYNLTDGYHPTFAELSVVIAQQLGKRKPLSIPYIIAKLMALAGDVLGAKSPFNSSKLKKITADLTFSDQYARQMLGWLPGQVLTGFKI